MRGCVAGNLQYPHTGQQKEEAQKQLKARSVQLGWKISLMCPHISSFGASVYWYPVLYFSCHKTRKMEATCVILCLSQDGPVNLK